jgi:hypothetical protein
MIFTIINFKRFESRGGKHLLSRKCLESVHMGGVPTSSVVEALLVIPLVAR